VTLTSARRLNEIRVRMERFSGETPAIGAPRRGGARHRTIRGRKPLALARIDRVRSINGLRATSESVAISRPLFEPSCGVN